jgi:YegS/Rv2252/BmrU family lipid kinase
MRCKEVSLIVDLRNGKNLTQIPDLVTVLAAAGWRTNISLKVFGGESMTLARKAVKKGYDAIIAYGGDGTLNQVVNGVMNAGGKTIVGVIPGGTANEWAGEINLPLDHAKAALTLINSEPRHVDLGQMHVEGLVLSQSFPHSQQSAKLIKSKNSKNVSSQLKHRFLLMAGLGIDASILAHVSKSVKYREGDVAFALTTLKELPQLHPFPVELWAGNTAAQASLLWQGQAWQILVANARHYGNLVDVAPNAHLDDGALDVCIMTAATPLATVEQVSSLLLKHKPKDNNTHYFHGPSFVIRIPASIGAHLDGSLIDLKDYVDPSDLDMLSSQQSKELLMVSYRFEAEPHALRIAIPRVYNGSLFLHSRTEEHSEALSIQQRDATAAQQRPPFESVHPHSPQDIDLLQQRGYEVRVVGVTPNPEKKDTYIIAGTMRNHETDEVTPIAIRVNASTIVVRRTGEQVAPSTVQELQEGTSISAVGKKNKKEVIRATSLLL